MAEKFNDLVSVKEPIITVISPSLNHSRFLRDTIESITQQSYRNFEHIVIDGGSTDNTVEILKEYPHIRWVSEKDSGILEAYRKALAMCRGKYIIQCCVSDGFLDRDWFKRCIEILDFDIETSLAWGLPQYMQENGSLGKISYAEFFDEPSPQKTDFFAFWLATGFWFPEGNYCVRRPVFDICLPKNSADPFYFNPALGFIYNFNTKGYLPYFIPVVANYGRIHRNSRGQRLYTIEKPLQDKYFEYIKIYRTKLFKNEIKHSFKDGSSSVLKEIGQAEVNLYKRKLLKYKLANSRFMRMNLYAFLKKIRQRLKLGVENR